MAMARANPAKVSASPAKVSAADDDPQHALKTTA
jgi:hypothetical protein